jgi:serine/threonine-protein kinase HipA
VPESNLNVFADKCKVGVIQADPEGRMSFRYSSSWLENPDSYHISVSLPLTEDTYSPERAHPFFANLLPEGPVREHVSKKLGISIDNDFELLSRIGGECAGALWIGPLDPPPVEEQSYTLISESELYDRITTSGVFSSIVGSGKARLSLAGAQDKLPVRVEDGKVMLPEKGAPSTHILKFPNRDFKDLPANEVLMISLASHLGLRTVETRLFRVGDIETCLVSRFDRIRDGSGLLRRLHQEDMCQAMGLPSVRKYEKEGGPSFKECFELIGNVCTEPVVERDQLIRWLIFNLLIGNSDAHGKNLSLLYRADGSMGLAPFYDLVCTLSYSNLHRDMAMNIGSRSDPGGIGPRQFDILAEECEVGSKWLRGYVLNMAEVTSVVLEAGLDRLMVDPSMHERVLPTIRKQTRQIRNAFRQAAGIGPDRKVPFKLDVP